MISGGIICPKQNDDERKVITDFVSICDGIVEKVYAELYEKVRGKPIVIRMGKSILNWLGLEE